MICGGPYMVGSIEYNEKDQAEPLVKQSMEKMKTNFDKKLIDDPKNLKNDSIFVVVMS